MTDAARRFLTLLAVTIITFVSSNLVIASALIALQVAHFEYSFFLAILCSVVVLWWGIGYSFPAARRKVFAIIFALFVGLTLLLILVNGFIMDLSVDGQMYHAEGILSLANGWNPFTTNAPEDSLYPTWLAFFSKGPWVNAAVLYRLTGNIETGKAFNGLLAIAALCLSLCTLDTLTTLRKSQVINLSLLLAFNPVTVYQLFTFYIDGQLASCIVLLICLFLLLDRQFNKFLLLAIGLLVVIILNLKLNGAIYLVILAGGYWIWYWLKRRDGRVQLTVCLISAGLIGGLFVGYNPFVSQYARQLLATGNPFYPNNWAEVIRIEPNTPIDLTDKDRLSKLFISLLSKSQPFTAASQLKVPFSIYPDELLSFRSPDVRLGGFGPLFSGALILSAVLAISLLIQWKTHRSALSLTAIFIGLILLSVISSSEGWWARYAPQLWLVPVLLAVTAFGTATLTRRLAIALMLVLTVNILLVAVTSLTIMFYDQQSFRGDLNHLKQITTEGQTIPTNFNGMPIVKMRFDEWKIAYQETSEMPACPEERLQNVLYTISIVCLPGNS